MVLTIEDDCDQCTIIAGAGAPPHRTLDEVIEPLTEQPAQHRRVAVAGNDDRSAQCRAPQQGLNFEQHRAVGSARPHRDDFDIGVDVVALRQIETRSIRDHEVVLAQLELLVLFVMGHHHRDELLLSRTHDRYAQPQHQLL